MATIGTPIKIGGSTPIINRPCTYRVSDMVTNNGNGAQLDFCDLLIVGELSQTGTCLYPDVQTSEMQFNVLDCSCYVEVKYGSAALGVEHRAYLECVEATKTLLTQQNYEACNCEVKFSDDKYIVYRSRIKRTVQVSTFPIVVNFDHYQRYYDDFIASPQKWYRTVERDEWDKVSFSDWKQVVLVGNTYTRLDSKQTDKQIRFVFELQFTEAAEAVTYWKK